MLSKKILAMLRSLMAVNLNTTMIKLEMFDDTDKVKTETELAKEI